MPKPTRRERRTLAEKGKLQPRRAAQRSIERLPAATTPSPVTAKAAVLTRDEPTTVSDPREYAHVKSDLMRIAALASALIAIIVALRFVLPQ